MNVTDLNGCPIEVTDLDEAIGLSAQYKAYRHEEKSYSDFDKKLRAYWTDMYEKLTAIKERFNNN